MMRVLFVGGMFDHELRAQVDKLSTGATQAAADALQWAYIRGLEASIDVQLDVLSSPYIGSYPRRYSRLWIASRELQVEPPTRGRLVGFLNAPVIKHVWRSISLITAGRRWVKQDSEPVVIVGYALTLPIVSSLWWIARTSNAATTILIIPDLPEFMDLSRTSAPLRSVLKTIDAKLLRRLLARLSGIVVLTRGMLERLPELPSVVIEGIYQPANFVDEHPAKRAPEILKGDDPYILYTGGINESYGVNWLCEAFQIANIPGLRLVLCGSGDSEEKARAYMSRDPRIVFLGRLPRGDVLSLQRRALFLINPRRNDEAFTAFSFPSKTLEYLGAGRPVLCYRLDGIPMEYDPYLLYVDGPTVHDLARSLGRVASMRPSELDDLGCAGAEFVLREKTPPVQIERMVRALWPTNPVETSK